MKELGIGSCSADGLLEIVDTRWDGNGTLYVTVRELIGGFESWVVSRENVIRRMRRLARRAIMYPENTRSSRVTHVWKSNGCSHVTFAVSRLEAW